jgi:hypothetical protein
LWTIAEAEEITRLITSGTIVPVLFSNIPRDRLRDVVYYNPVVKQKYNTDGSIKFRVRGTAGGNLLQVPYDVSARTASLDVVKFLLHSVVSELTRNGSRLTLKIFTSAPRYLLNDTSSFASNVRKFQIKLCSTTSSTPFSTTTTFTSELKNACMDYLKLDV